MSQTSKKPAYVNFEQLENLRANLYYNNHSCQFQLGQVIFQVNEDESDGYRSYLRDVEIISVEAPARIRDFLAEVIIKKSQVSNRDGWEIVDANDSHVWLEFGTDNSDDYYPSFIFYTYPKPGKIETKDEN